MQATGNQNVSEPLRLTPQQQRVLEALKDRETQEYPLSLWYLGALYALNNVQNPDRISQAAQSLRELIEKLPRVVEGSDVQGSSPNFHQTRANLQERILKNKENYPNGWKNKQIDGHLDKTLKQFEEYLESSQKPTRRELMQMAVTTIDPMADRLDLEIRERKRDELYELWDNLEGIAHHRIKQNIDNVESCLNKLEVTIIDLLAPITAQNQNDIQTILGNANKSETDVEKMFSLIESRGANYVFFFKHAADNAEISWLSHLENRDYFANPPNAEPIGEGIANYPFWWPMRYLARMARHAQDDVIEIVLRLPKTDNPWIYNEILEIALQLHGTYSAKLEPKILEYANLEYHFLAYRFADVLTHWTKEKQTTAALKLTKALVKFVPDPKDECKRKRREEEPIDLDALLAMLSNTRLEPSPRFGSMEYCRILSEGVRPLAAKKPCEVAFLLIKAAADMVRLRMHQEDIGKAVDYSDYWYERLTESKGDYENAEKSLVHTLTFACQQVYEKSLDSVEDLDRTLRAQPWGIFKRLRHHLFAQYPTETTKPWIRELIREYEKYEQWEYGYEFQQMIRSACEHFGTALLPIDELKHILDRIRNGPSKDDRSEEEFKQHQRRFHRKQFRPFAPVLFDEYKTYFQELEAEAGGYISDDDYPPFKTRGGHVSTHSPRSPDELANLTDEELLTFINEWDGKEVSFESNHFIEVNVQGLSHALQTVFKAQIVPDPKRHSFWMENGNRIERPVFVEKIINAMQECVEENNLDNLDEWLVFSEWVLSHPEDIEHGKFEEHAGESQDNSNWTNCRYAMSEFLITCFRKDVDLSISTRARFAKLLDMLCTQRDQYLDSNLKGNELIDQIMNTPRCRGLEALVNFGLWLRRTDPTIDVRELAAILEKRFAPEAAYPLALPEYDILGGNYGRLFYLNEAWTIAHKSDLFPQRDFSKWLAAFDGFLIHNGPSRPTFESLRDDYVFALQNLKQLNKRHTRRDQLILFLGKHLFCLYLWDEYPLTGNESLLEEFYKVTADNPEHWASLFEYVGRTLWESNEQLDSSRRNRIIEFFNWRLAAKEPKELRAFTFWLKAKPLDARWRLSAYSKVLDTCKVEDMEVAIQIDALSEMLPDYTAEVVASFAKLTDGFRSEAIDFYAKGAKTILKAGVESSDEKVRRDASRAYENLLRTGRLDLKALADELADKFMEFVGPDCPPLSDYAVSREGIYEDDI